MFTGIIAAVGQIKSATPSGDGFRLTIDAGGLDLSDVILGDSIAIQGACMTVIELTQSQNTFAIEISAESINKTSGLKTQGPVNLEKALRLNDRLGGHLVSGHVDGVGHVETFEIVGSNVDDPESSWHLAINAPAFLAKYLAYKGSIVVNGTSLTVNQVEDLQVRGNSVARVHINIIPHTLTHTTLKYLKPGDAVNLEVDLIARYVERMLSLGHLEK
ncbi:MAG: riboflavin synthase [Betaproteobacteria bacterium]